MFRFHHVKKYLPIVFATFIVFAQTLDASAQDGAPNGANGQVLSVGVVPQFEPRKLAGIWLPILNALETRTGLKFHLVGSKDIPEFEAKLARGEFDLAYMNPYHLLVANRQQGYEPLVRDGGRALYGILVVAKNSPIRDVQGLDGAEIAFPAPNALGASLLMRAELDRKVGIQIKPKYVKTHSSVYLNVALGQTSAGGGVIGTFNRQPADVRDSLRILYTTRDMPPHPLAAHPRLSDEVRATITQAVLDMAASAEGQALLANVPFKQVKATTYEEYAFMADMGLEDYYVTAE